MDTNGLHDSASAAATAEVVEELLATSGAISMKALVRALRSVPEGAARVRDLVGEKYWQHAAEVAQRGGAR